ncbi:MAG: hypothetical protein HS116_26475 [Planctomycetes bacterium]|nr:hypothetical protein [Planctomycetota bacterium]
MSKPFGVITVITASHLAAARTLFESVRKHHPEAVCVAILVDRIDGRFDSQRESFSIWPVEELKISKLSGMLFQYTRFERVMAFKAFGLGAFVERHSELDKFFYIDADFWILGKLDRALEFLDTHSLLLTPHTLQPVLDTRWMNERVFARTGAFNLGFLGLRRSKEAKEFLSWWTQKMSEYCVSDLPNGMFADQKWMDLAPALFEGVGVFRDPGYNVAAWNLEDRKLSECASQGQWTAGGAELVAMHFSKFDPEQPADDYWRRAGPGQPPNPDPVLDRLAGAYARRLLANGWSECRSWKHVFDYFNDGTLIPPLWPIYYRDVLRHRLPKEHDPFTGLPPSLMLSFLRSLSLPPLRFRDRWWYQEWLRVLRGIGFIPKWWQPVK